MESKYTIVVSALKGDLHSPDDNVGGLFLLRDRYFDHLDTISTTGISYAENKFYRLVWNEYDATVDGVLIVYSEKETIKQVVPGLREPHDLMVIDDSIIAVSTLDNSLVWISKNDYKVTNILKFPGEGDAWHINTLTNVSNEVYACAFGIFSKHREWKEHMIGSGIVFNIRTKQTFISGLSAPHNAIFHDNHWIVCNSATSELLKIDTGGKIVRRTTLQGWLRGLLITDDKLVVGQSRHRHAEKHERSSIIMLDINSWVPLDVIELKCGEIFGIDYVPNSFIKNLTAKTLLNITGDK